VISKKYIDEMIVGTTLHKSKPKSPATGDFYIDPSTNNGYIFDGSSWELVSCSASYEATNRLVPTTGELDKHPTLKEAWEQYMIVRKLLGI